jgi:hypothetical protein
LLRAPTPETRFEYTPEWLHVHARGAFDVPWLTGFVTEVMAAAKAADPALPAILVDVRELTGPRPDGMTLYDLGVLASRDIIGVRVAFVASEAFVDPRRFGESVARNRGLNLRVFTDMNEALGWLRTT